MAAETDNPSTTDRFELDGAEYEVPSFTDLTIDDWTLVYDESKVVLADFGPIFDDEEAEAARVDKLRNPRVEKAFLMIAYLRVHPDADLDEVRDLTGRARLVPLIDALRSAAEEEGDDADDPTKSSALSSENELKPSSKTSYDESDESSPAASALSSETPEDRLATTGTSG